MKGRNAPLILCLLALSLQSLSQDDLQGPLWHKIESAIDNNDHLDDISRQLTLFKEKALAAHDIPDLARCLRDQMLIADKRTEDSVFFKNSLYIDCILNDERTTPLLRSIMYIIRAQRINNYSSRFLNKKSRYLVGNYGSGINYVTLSQAALDSLANDYFERAKKISRDLDTVPIRKLLWLSHEPLTFLFRPDLTDIIFWEQIASQSGFAGQYSPMGPQRWLSLSQDDFIRIQDTTMHLPVIELSVLHLYKDWINDHLLSPAGEAYFIETLARRHFYQSLTPDSANALQYEQYLQVLTRSPFTTVQAHAVYQLCLRWNDEAGQYDPNGEDGYFRGYRHSRNFDSAYRMYYNRILSEIDGHQRLLDSFPVFRDALLKLKARIFEPAFQVTSDESHLPGSPILAFLKFRNIRELHIRVVKVDRNDEFLQEPGTGRPHDPDHYLSLPAYRDAVQPLPADSDHQWHNSFLKIDPLPTGHFVLLFSESIMAENSGRTDYIPIIVTNMAVIDNDQRVFVLNRTTGYPMTGAIVIPEFEEKRKDTGSAPISIRKEKAPLKVNASGFVLVGDDAVDRLKIYAAGDSLLIPFHQAATRGADKIFDKDSYDDLMDYYEENIQLHMYTDRSIYRPGQTVHYKGIFLISDPNTGKLLVLNWKNLQFPFFKKLYYRLAVKFANKKLEVYIKDPFNKTIDTIRIVPNQFGSFTGGLVLSLDAAVGGYSFDDEYSRGQVSGEFRVEEYRRPSFELKLEKPHNELQLGDSFRITAHTVSFAGASLDHVRLKYTITARGTVPDPGLKKNSPGKYRDESVSTGQEYTDDRGDLVINILDTALNRYHFTDDRIWQMVYSIEVEAVDATGESHSEELQFTISSRPVKLNMQLDRVMEKKDLLPLYIAASSEFAGPVKKRVELRLYKLPLVKTNPGADQWPATDVSLYSKQDLQRWFGDIFPDHKQEPPGEGRQLIFQDSLIAGEDKFKWPDALMNRGRYELDITCREKGKVTGEWQREFSLFDRASNAPPGETASFEYLHVNLVKPGDQMHWITGNTVQDIFSIYHLAYYAKTQKGALIKYAYDIRPEKKGLNEWQYTMPRNAMGTAQLTHLYIFNDHLYKQQQSLILDLTADPKPQVIIERYRKKLVPGGKETFLLTVKTGDQRQPAELMTTLYDASLDKLEKLFWQLPDPGNPPAIWGQWEGGINIQAAASWADEFLTADEPDPALQKTLWWLVPADYPYFPKYRLLNNFDGDGSKILYGRVAGVSILDTKSLNDVVVIGYGARKKDLTGTVIQIRRAGSLSNYSKLLLILDGVPYKGDIQSLDINLVTDGIVLKGSDAVALFGASAAGGVLVLSTKGPVQLPQTNETPPPAVVRRNFAETAFFYGQLHSGRNGYYRIPFTLPESVTEWKWKMLAHTKNALFTYEERTLYSQLPLMVQPDMPRFLYQGDTSLLISRISNIDSIGHPGVLQCHIEDAVTGEDITRKLTVSGHKDFSAQAGSTTSGSFLIAVPADFLHPLRIKITAAAGNYTDGEEHIVPILAKKILAIRNVPYVADNKKDWTIITPELPADAEPFGVGLYIDPPPQATMINALPYLAEYPYDCAEQTFNKLLAHSLAIHIVQKERITLTLSPDKAATINAHQAIAGDTDNEPGFPDGRSIPWLHLNNLAATQQAALHKLLDTLRGLRQIEKYFDDLRQMQNSEGGISWFKGGRSDLFISEYLIAGFGKMSKDSLSLPKDPNYPGFLSRLIAYCDNEFARSRESLSRGILQDYFYARSFWTKEFPLVPNVAQRLDSLLDDYWKHEKSIQAGVQASMIGATLRYSAPGHPLYQAAMRELASLRQSAITETTKGVRWKELSDPGDLSTGSEEWIVRIAEAFEQGDPGQTVTGIVKWLLQSRLDHHWGTTKSTADAVILLDRQRLPAIGNSVSWKIPTLQALPEVSDNLLAGQLFAFSPVSGSFPRELTIQAQTSANLTGNSNLSGEINYSSGGINYYYFSGDPTSGMNRVGAKISKTLYRQNASTHTWEPVTAGMTLKITDKIKTVLTIDAPRQLQYVFIDEKRAATLEPTDPESKYVYGDDIEYYRSLRDIGVQFFAEKIPAGISTISYESVVDREGSYLEGPAALQCMYQPSISAYSKISTLKVIATDRK